MKSTNLWRPAIFFSVFKLLLHLFTADTLGFHRDEFLYLALGRHLDWGFWSNGPFTAFVSWVSQATLGGSLLATRLWPALAGALIVYVSLRITERLGGGRTAQILCGTALLVSPAMLRSASMLQPVVWDVLFWTLSLWMVAKYIGSEQRKQALGLGAAVGLGLLNKYSVVFLLVCLPLALLLTPARRLLGRTDVWLAAGVALIAVAPNMYWQWAHGFPVVQHLRELSETQLVAVNPLNFLLDQLLMNGFGCIVWLPGLWWLFSTNAGKWRALGWFAVLTLALLLLLRGKSYYTLGIYPMLTAAGAVCWERLLAQRWARAAVPTLLVLSSAPLLPVGIPVLPAPQLAKYFNNLGIESVLRWERGNVEALPQDYADMLGWNELAALADTAVARAGRPENILLYAENYGQAGAVEQLSSICQDKGMQVVSFADSYRLWAPRRLTTQCNTLVYINDELGEDVQALFGDIECVGKIENPLARERGTAVYVCRQPRRSFPEFWAMRVEGLHD